MARKLVVKSYKLWDSADLSGNLTSNITNVIHLDKASIHVTWTGSSPDGTITVEATNDDPASLAPVWRELDMGSAITVSGASGEHDLIFNELPFNAVRLKYAVSSGTGNINATIHSKSVGA